METIKEEGFIDKNYKKHPVKTTVTLVGPKQTGLFQK